MMDFAIERLNIDKRHRIDDGWIWDDDTIATMVIAAVLPFMACACCFYDELISMGIVLFISMCIMVILYPVQGTVGFLILVVLVLLIRNHNGC